MAWLDTDYGSKVGTQTAPPPPITAPALPDSTRSIRDYLSNPTGDVKTMVDKVTAPVAAPPPPTAPNSFDSDPRVAQARALENQGIGSLDSWLKSAREQAIIQSGDPALASAAGFGLDPQAGVFARQNYLSGNADLARVDRAKKLAHQAIINKLAARGLLRSGDLGYLEGQSNIDFGNQEYDVRQAILSKLSEFMRQYLERKQALKQATLGAYQDAYDNADLNSGLGASSSLFAAPPGSMDDPVYGNIDDYLWRRR